MNKQNIKSYLPSHEFVIRLIILVILLGLTLGAKTLYDYFKNKRPENKTALSTETIRVSSGITVANTIAKDTNANGIPDWEESLWGLDPETNGPENKSTIENKKNSIRIQNGSNPSEDTPENETDLLAREFFSTFMALKQSDTLNSNAIENLTTTIGQKVGDTELPDTYSTRNIKTSSDTKESMLKYQLDLERIITKKQDTFTGDELSIMADAMENEDSESMNSLLNISSEYKSLAKDLTTISIPKNLVLQHLDMVNSYDKIGTAILNMSEAISNPINATTGTVMYTRYTKQINQNIESIRTIFIDNGILVQDAI